MKIQGKRAIILSDTHLGARSNSIEWLDVMKDWFYEDFIVKIKEVYDPVIFLFIVVMSLIIDNPLIF